MGRGFVSYSITTLLKLNVNTNKYNWLLCITYHHSITLADACISLSLSLSFSPSFSLSPSLSPRAAVRVQSLVRGAAVRVRVQATMERRARLKHIEETVASRKIGRMYLAVLVW